MFERILTCCAKPTAFFLFIIHCMQYMHVLIDKKNDTANNQTWQFAFTVCCLIFIVCKKYFLMLTMIETFQDTECTAVYCGEFSLTSHTTLYPTKTGCTKINCRMKWLEQTLFVVIMVTHSSRRQAEREEQQFSDLGVRCVQGIWETLGEGCAAAFNWKWLIHGCSLAKHICRKIHVHTHITLEIRWTPVAHTAVLAPHTCFPDSWC